MQALAAAAGLSGLEHLQAISEGRLPGPPIAVTMGMTGFEAHEGRATFFGEAGEFLYNPIGLVHGGFAMTLLDSAMGCAVQTTLAAGEMHEPGDQGQLRPSHQGRHRAGSLRRRGRPPGREGGHGRGPDLRGGDREVAGPRNQHLPALPQMTARTQRRGATA